VEQQQWEQRPPASPAPQSSSAAPQILGIISLVLGILAFVFSFIPCLGVYAFFPGILGIACGVTALALAAKSTGSKAMAIIGLVLSLLGTIVAGFQYNRMHNAIRDLTTTLKDTVKMRQLGDSILQDMHDLDTSNHSMKIIIDTSASK